jgi:hypothetical protein
MQCFQKDVHRRVRAKDLKKHTWLKGDNNVQETSEEAGGPDSLFVCEKEIQIANFLVDLTDVIHEIETHELKLDKEITKRTEEQDTEDLLNKSQTLTMTMKLKMQDKSKLELLKGTKSESTQKLKQGNSTIQQQGL